MDEATPAEGSARTKKQQLVFRVVSKGFEETYDTKEAALKQAGYLKKRAVKEKEPVKIKVTEEDGNGKSKVIHEVNIKEDFYED